MRQSILKKAFEGKLCPQDPNDEPASNLLERIKIERAKREAEKSAASKARTTSC
jgi:type I restriction enzyme S subunit